MKTIIIFLALSATLVFIAPSYAQNANTDKKTMILSFCESLEADLSKDLNCTVTIDAVYSNEKLKRKVSDAPDNLGPIEQTLTMTANETSCPKVKSLKLHVHQLNGRCQVVIYFGEKSSKYNIPNCDLYKYLSTNKPYILDLMEGGKN